MSRLANLPGPLARFPNTDEYSPSIASLGLALTVHGLNRSLENPQLIYTGADPTPEQIAAIYAEIARVADLPPPTPTRSEGATAVPTPGLALDLGTGAQRFGTLYCQTVNQVSDARLKADIAPLPAPLGLGLVRALRPVGFRYAGGRRTHLGFVAQDVRAALAAAAPGADLALWCSTPVPPGADPAATGLPAGAADVESLRPDQLLAPLVAAAQELDARTAALEAAAAAPPAAAPPAEATALPAEAAGQLADTAGQLAAAIATAAAAEASAAAAVAEAAALHAQVGRLQAQIDALRDAVDALAKLSTAQAAAGL